MSDRTAGFPTDIKVQGGLRQNHALHFNSFNNEMSSSSLDVGLLTTTLYILGGGLLHFGVKCPLGLKTNILYSLLFCWFR